MLKTLLHIAVGSVVMGVASYVCGGTIHAIVDIAAFTMLYIAIRCSCIKRG